MIKKMAINFDPPLATSDYLVLYYPSDRDEEAMEMAKVLSKGNGIVCLPSILNECTGQLMWRLEKVA